MLFGILLLAFLGLGIPALFSYFVWRLFGLNKAKLPLWGAIVVFVSGALTTWTFWGHAGPVPAILMLLRKANGQYLPWMLWMLCSGLCMVILFALLSYRRSRTRTYGSPSFTVQFGKVARTIDYADSIGSVVFTFDVKGKEPGAPLVLEHWAKTTPRDPRYDPAFQRTKEFLESRGYAVEIWGE